MFEIEIKLLKRYFRHILSSSFYTEFVAKAKQCVCVCSELKHLCTIFLVQPKTKKKEIIIMLNISMDHLEPLLLVLSDFFPSLCKIRIYVSRRISMEND